MTGRVFPPDFIAAVRAASDIVDVVSDYVRLKKVGQNYVGLCPFHNEDTPSFTVNRGKQMFYCFGCNAGGDVIEFIKQRERVDFPEAVRLLAERAHLPLPARTKEDEERWREREELYYANALALEYFRAELNRPDGEAARRYLERRGIAPAQVEDFGLGYAPARWDGLLSYLEKRGIPPQTAVRAGLAVARQQGNGAYDRFRDRLMFPIRDLRGRVIAFGGRVLGNGEPKYLNSPETPIYSKGRTLYALDRARASIEKENRVLVVEGYLDAVTCHQFGFTWTVASLGTALTREQVDLLKRFSTEVFIGYDADAAGQAATVRGLELTRAAGCRVRVLQVPVGKDPDEFLHTEGREAFAALVEGALPLPDYHYQRLVAKHGKETLEGRVAIAREMVPVLAGIESAVEREEYTRRVAQDLGLRVEALAAEIRRSGGVERGKRPERANKGPAVSFLVPAPRRAEAEALMRLSQLFIFCPQTRAQIAAEIAPEKLGNLPQAVLLRTLLELFQEGEQEFSLPTLSERLPDQGARECLAELAVREDVPSEAVDKLLADYLRLLRRLWVEEEIERLKKEIISLNREGKNEASANLIRRLNDLHREANRLKQAAQLTIPTDGRKEGGTRRAQKG
ncbi:MAG: primase [Bacillota bacterium]|jgi:DNA primase|nr:primase [Bacillota bacterium]